MLEPTGLPDSEPGSAYIAGYTRVPRTYYTHSYRQSGRGIEAFSTESTVLNYDITFHFSSGSASDAFQWVVSNE